MVAKKNHTIEALKLFASFMVVFIHIVFNGKFGDAVDALARFAVPFFLLVSGYFSYQITCEKIKNRIKYILSLYVFSAFCCTIFEIIQSLKYNTDGLTSLLNKFTDFGTYVNLLAFNTPVSSGHLWYLLAVLYVYVIFYFATKFHLKEKAVFVISFSLLLLHLFLGEGLSLFGIALPIKVVRNFALMGIPFFGIGLFVKKHEQKFKKIPNYIIFMFVIVGAFESVISRFFLGSNELYIGSLFVLVAIVCVFTKFADVKYSSFFTALEGCSTYIYIFHIIISRALLIIYGIVGIDIYSSAALENLHPIIVCVVSTVFSYFFIKTLKKVRKNKTQIHKTKVK